MGPDAHQPGIEAAPTRPCMTIYPKAPVIHMLVSSPTCACSEVRLDANPVVDRVSKTLFTAEISLSRLNGDVAEQKLDLVQFPSGIAAQAGAGPTEVMRSQLINGCSFGAVLHDVPHNPLRHTISQVLPARQTHRNTRPSLSPADASHESMALLTQSGTGTVRTCRALPTKSTIAQ